VETGSNTSTVTLRVVGGDEKGSLKCERVSFCSALQKKATRVEAVSNTSTVTLRVVGGNEKKSLESETVKYGHESYGIGPEND
jgi:hypothetical protein